VKEVGEVREVPALECMEGLVLKLALPEGSGLRARVIPQELDHPRPEPRLRFALVQLPAVVRVVGCPEFYRYILLPQSSVKPPSSEVLSQGPGLLGIALPRFPSSEGDTAERERRDVLVDT
jgi:hypothetical protein